MRVVFTPASLRDLKAIGDFIAQDNRKRAGSYIAELRAACLSLSSDPLRYPIHFALVDFRRMPVGNYVVLYRVGDDRVQIVRVVHSARDVDSLTFEH